MRSANEGRYLFGGLSLAEREGLQIVYVSGISLYKEYEPLTEVDSVAGFGVLFFVVKSCSVQH